MIYRAVPYLVAAAPPVILLLALMISGCTMTRTANDPVVSTGYYSDPDSRAGDALVRELDRRAAREDLRRLINEVQR